MYEKEYPWTIKLDWLNILNLLNLDSISQINEEKREKAIKKLTKTFGIETLMDLGSNELDQLVADELKDVMKKELSLIAKKEEQIEKEIRSKIIPFKKGGINKIDPRDFKDIDPNSDPEDILKAIYKKMTGDGDKDDEDEDKNSYNEDSTGYHIQLLHPLINPK